MQSKAAALRAAISHRWPADVILVWHLGMLKLVPFLRPGGARVMLYLHGIEGWRSPGPVERALLRKVDLFLSNSDYTWQRFLQFHPGQVNSRHRTVPLGIGTPLEQPQVPQHAPRVLTLGRAMRGELYSKGHREMILCWPRVVAAIPEARLDVAGPGDLIEEFRDLVRNLHLTDSVTVWGAVTEETKETLLAECRVFALPSRGEGFGLVYLEAMRRGRPCVVSHADAGREVVVPPKCGESADPQDPAALAEVLIRLLADRESWRFKSEAATFRYNRDYSASAFQQRIRRALNHSGGALCPAISTV